MSAWKIIARALYAIGGSGTAREFDVPDSACRSALKRLQVLGMVRHNGKRGSLCILTLTALGIAWCEGRAIVIGGCFTGKAKVCATWLASLPTGLRLEARAA